jgi:hypothetical protein
MTADDSAYSNDSERESPSFVRRNLNAKVEAVLDEATQRNQSLLERVRELLGSTLDDVLIRSDMEEADDDS